MLDYFSIFGLPRQFGVDRAALERKFYELSRDAHPDRFVGAGSAAQRDALERMSLLNEAYRTLKNPEELRAYVLKLEGLGDSATSKGAIPAELAESWFELQDAVMEAPQSARERIAAFELELGELRAARLEAMVALERQIDSGSVDRSAYERLAAGVREQSYLKSMERDVERLKARFKS